LLPSIDGYKRVQHCDGSYYGLSKKGEFAWSNAAAKAFVEIKVRIISVPVMHLSDFSKIFEVTCDTSV